jgi:hypothetical protein
VFFVDIDDYTNSKVDISTLKKLGPVLSNYFPDILHKMFIINSNSFFKIIFKGLQTVMHPVTKKKINMIGKDNKEIRLRMLDFLS